MSERFSALRRAAADRLRPWWSRLVTWMETQAEQPLSNRQAAEILLGGLGAGLLAVFLLIALLTGITHGVSALSAGAQTVPHAALVRVASDAIQHWVAVHTVGLAVSPAAVLTVWAAGGSVLALAGAAGSRGARVAWPAYGAATVAMAWLGASDPHRPIAAGLVGLAWAVVSIFVLHRGGAGKPVPRITVHAAS